MSLKSRIYVGFIVSLGAAVLADGLYHWDQSGWLRFLYFVVLAVPASCLKVTLPGVTGTMSMLFVFLLAGAVELPLPEALAMGAICAAAQSFWHARMRPRATQVLFSAAVIQIAVASAYFTYRSIPASSSPFRLLLTAAVLFIANTLPVAVVIALTESKAIGRVWRGSYFWCFPYYLVGASIVGFFASFSSRFDWRVGVLVLPVVYVVYRSYYLYLNQLQSQRQQAEDERAHAAEVAELHAQTVEALASAISANARLDAVFRASPLALLTLDGDSRVTAWNAMAEQIFGLSSEDVVGKRLPCAAGRSEEILQGVVARALRGEVFAGEEIKQWRSNGSPFDAAIWTATFNDTDGTSRILIEAADVSARKELEEQLRLSQKMEAVGRLAGGVAHDFNNLLTVINGYACLLLGRLGGDTNAATQLKAILSAGTNAAELVSQLLTFSRRQMIKPRSFEINEFVRSVQKMLERVIGEHIELRTRLQADAGWIHADLNQMEGVLLNLSANARDAMADGGVLTIETERVDIGADRTTPRLDLAPGSYIRLIVKDTGHGMDGETQRRLFEPFYTTKAEGRGTGLGLSSVYGGVEQNHGRIVVSSEPGKGSEFSIYLPRVEAPGLAVEAPVSVRPPAAGTGTILLVEDENAVREMLRVALKQAGYRVLEARDGAEAIQLWGGELDRIDLVVTDIVMPALNGLRLRDELQKRRPGMSVLCMSGHAQDLITNQSQFDVPPDTLQKPVLPDVLVRKVRDLLDQGSGRSRAAAPGRQ